MSEISEHTEVMMQKHWKNLSQQPVPEDPLQHAIPCAPSALLCQMQERRVDVALEAHRLAERLQAEAGKAPSEMIYAVLHKFRRGKEKSKKAKQAALLEIQTAMENPEGFQMAILMLPRRDANRFKCLGHFSDAGELEALLQLWKLVQTVRHLQEMLQLPGPPCVLHIFQDPNRYPCFNHLDPKESEDYTKALKQILESLKLEGLCLGNCDDQGRQECKEAFEHRLLLQKELYNSELQKFLDDLEPKKDLLLEARSEEEFQTQLRGLHQAEKLRPLTYAVLRSIPPGALHLAKDAPAAQAQLLQLLVNIHQPVQHGEHGQPAACSEEMRKELLWQSVTGAAQYLSAYYSRSGICNGKGVDDVSGLAPGCLRLSIHSKDPESPQFGVSIAHDPHLVPWHGSAEWRWFAKTKRIGIDVKLAAEMWHSHIPVIPVVPQMPTSDPSVFAPAWDGYCLALGQAQQPFFFVHPGLALTFLAVSEEDCCKGV